MNKLKAWYAGLQVREQRFVLIGGIGLAIIVLVVGILMPLQAAVSSVTSSNDKKRQDIAWMRVNSQEIRAAAGRFQVDINEPPVVIVDRTARSAGLADALRGTQPSGSGVRVQIESGSFDQVVSWLATLDQNYGLAVESITVDRTPKPGLINASISFNQSRP